MSTFNTFAVDSQGFNYYGFQIENDPCFPKQSNQNLEKIEEQYAFDWSLFFDQMESPSNQQQLIEKVFKGIPNSIRGKVWQKLFKVDQLKTQYAPNYYQVKKVSCFENPLCLVF